ncbi:MULTISPECIES: hypothetical protein [Mycobacterium]|uniref:Uncharacterized protein n=2 Tax=Mycobacterium TaxID=1763 RepID=A0ABP8F3H8_9MYCO|nr:hypothetical protein [Mycobacterium avium]ETA92261.1 hypothetical protein O982_24160 [Mycobacterium avium 10-5581]PBJ33452.1 hypothetical protein BI294_18205 [Mycobacterium avium subsp. hominissuis]QLK92815.1 hypothetical protein BEP52_24860 [Mycobacterium avium subsp. hominissuis]QWY63772.1 hypothetical protein BJP74_24695 [Mycobacterium avium subsp. hominissuis]QWY65029.1 hypothetical protein BJP78_25570 [Mycobacterium avium subsp. hominissuis]
MTTAPTTFGQRTAEYLGYQLATRPRLRRATTLWLITHTLVTAAVGAAPPAAASTLAGALNWTGVTDSHGVPVGSYYLSVVSTSEAITKAGPGLSADPSSWARWLANAVTTGLSHEFIVELLQAQAAVYIFMIAMSLWLLRFAMSNTWLLWLATWFRPIFETIRIILADLWVFPICLMLGLGVGAFHMMWHGRKGFGSGIMLSTVALGVLGTMLTHDPLSDLYNENGLLAQGRNLGFSVSQAAFNNGSITTGGGQAQLQHLTGLIADATVRMPLQLMNFGTTVDDIGNCGGAYTAAMLAPHDAGDLAGPAHAMASCGAPQALSFAQHLSGANLALGACYGLLGAVFVFFVCYVTYSYVMVCCAAFVNALLSIVAAAPAMIHGHPRRRAARRIKMFFKHAALVFAYTTYISMAAMIVLKMGARGGYADQVGMSHPLARLFMIAIVSAVAIGVFWWLKRELGDHTRHEFTHTITDLVHRGRDGYQRGQDAYDRARALNARAPWSKTPDSDAPDSSDDPDQPLTGPPVNGRPPAGRPPSPGRPRHHPPGSPPTTPAPASGAAATEETVGTAAVDGAVIGGEAAAAVVAPEVVAGAALATHVAHRIHRDHSHAAGGRPTSTSANRATQTPAATTPSTGQLPAPPVSGRAGVTGPTPTQRGAHPGSAPDSHTRATRPPLSPGDPRSDDGDAPVQGRS